MAWAKARKLRPTDKKFFTVLKKTFPFPHGLKFFNIGANDGKRGDPLFYLAKKLRWTGLFVEPNPLAFNILKKNFPQSVCLNVAIHPTEKTSFLYVPEPEKMSIKSSMLDTWIFAGKMDKKPIVVNCVTLQELVDRFFLPDILHIDVEGFESQVLDSLNLNKFRPKVIHFEALFNQEECKNMLMKYGYSFSHDSRDITAFLTG